MLKIEKTARIMSLHNIWSPLGCDPTLQLSFGCFVSVSAISHNSTHRSPLLSSLPSASGAVLASALPYLLLHPFLAYHGCVYFLPPWPFKIIIIYCILSITIYPPYTPFPAVISTLLFRSRSPFSFLLKPPPSNHSLPRSYPFGPYLSFAC